jgi:hypothetical protein
VEPNGRMQPLVAVSLLFLFFLPFLSFFRVFLALSSLLLVRLRPLASAVLASCARDAWARVYTYVEAALDPPLCLGHLPTRVLHGSA